MSDTRNKTNNLRWANDSNKQRIHVKDAISGRNGYYCIDCEVSMQANKGNKLHTQYFSHDPTARIGSRNCQFSDETYRHSIGIQILERIKQVMVPRLYKFPPAGTEGMAVKLKDSKLISASSVKVKEMFYRDEFGQLRWEKEDVSLKDNCIIPDLAFFDHNGDPILFIEIVATHKVDKEKLFKIMALGVDTIEITIPKHFNEIEIENIFKETTHTKWIYSYEQQNTDYLHLPKRTTEGVQSFDEYERRNFEAVGSFECKAFQISELIRRIKKCLESEQYRGASKGIADQLLRVQQNTERNRDNIHELRGRLEEEVSAEFEGRRRKLELEEKRFREEKGQFDIELGNLQERIKRELEKEFESEESKLESERTEMEGGYNIKNCELEEEERAAGIEEGSLENEERGYSSNRHPDIRRITSEIRIFESTEGNIDDRMGQIRAMQDRVRGEKESVESNIAHAQFQTTILDVSDEFDTGRIKKEFEGLREQSARAIGERDYKGTSRVAYRIGTILDRKELVYDYKQAELSNQKLCRARKILEEKLFKKWI